MYFFISVSLHISLSPGEFSLATAIFIAASGITGIPFDLPTCKILSANISPGDPTPVPTYRCKSIVDCFPARPGPRLENFRIFPIDEPPSRRVFRRRKPKVPFRLNGITQRAVNHWSCCDHSCANVYTCLADIAGFASLKHFIKPTVLR